MIFCFMGLAVKFKFAYSLYLFHIMKLRFVLWYLYLELYSSRLDCQEKTEKKFRLFPEWESVTITPKPIREK